MNPRPIQTGKQIFHFSRTFRHYVEANVNGHISADGNWEDNWHIIPYMHICSSLKPRDWQMINTISKRWRVLSAGFDMEHIIPVIDTDTTLGGALTGNVNFNMMPYMESFIDKAYILPEYSNIADDKLPNNEMLTNNPSNRGDATLKTYDVTFPNMKSTSPTNDVYQNYSTTSFNRYAKRHGIIFELMNSTEWGTIQPSDNFSFEWTPSQLDMNKWRHAMRFLNTVHHNDNFHPANPIGRWDGGIKKNNLTYTGNARYNSTVVENFTQPGPACLLRPAQFLNLKNELVKIGFTMLIKYHSTIECDINDVPGAPIFLSHAANLADFNSGTKCYENIYFIEETDKNNQALQNPGSNIVKGFAGPDNEIDEY